MHIPKYRNFLLYSQKQASAFGAKISKTFSHPSLKKINRYSPILHATAATIALSSMASIIFYAVLKNLRRNSNERSKNLVDLNKTIFQMETKGFSKKEKENQTNNNKKVTFKEPLTYLIDSRLETKPRDQKTDDSHSKKESDSPNLQNEIQTTANKIGKPNDEIAPKQINTSPSKTRTYEKENNSESKDENLIPKTQIPGQIDNVERSNFSVLDSTDITKNKSMSTLNQLARIRKKKNKSPRRSSNTSPLAQSEPSDSNSILKDKKQPTSNVSNQTSKQKNVARQLENLSISTLLPDNNTEETSPTQFNFATLNFSPSYNSNPENLNQTPKNPSEDGYQNIQDSIILSVTPSPTPKNNIDYSLPLENLAHTDADVNSIINTLNEYPQNFKIEQKPPERTEKLTFQDQQNVRHSINIRPLPEYFESTHEVSYNGRSYSGSNWRQKLASEMFEDGFSEDDIANTLSHIIRTTTIDEVQKTSNNRLNPDQNSETKLTSFASGKVKVEITAPASNLESDIMIHCYVKHQLALKQIEHANEQIHEILQPLPLESTAVIETRIQRNEDIHESKKTFEIFYRAFEPNIQLDVEHISLSDPISEGWEEISDHSAPAVMPPRPIRKVRTWLEALKNLVTQSGHLALEMKYILSLQATGIDAIPGKARDIYHKTLWKYRKQLEENPNSELALKFAYNRFTKNKLYTYCRQLVEAVVLGGLQRLHPNAEIEAKLIDLSWQEQIEAINNMPPELDANRLAVNFSKLLFQLGIKADPHFFTNVPYASYDMRCNKKNVTCLRFGTPTEQNVEKSDSWWNPFKISRVSKIIPEMIAFLKYKRDNDKGGHLYINLQNRDGEQIRTDPIEGLAETEGLKEVAFVATLSKDCAFYKQKNYPIEMKASDFVQEFMNQMNSQESGFFFSANLNMKKQENQDLLLKALNDTHSLLFPGKENLSLQDRRIFIEVAYALITLQLIKISNSTTFNIACKDAIDRAGTTNSILFYVLMMMSKKAEDEEMRRQHMVVTHAPALIVKKQAIIPDRFNRFLEAINTLRPENKHEREILNANFAKIAHDYGIRSKPTVADNGKGVFDEEPIKPVHRAEVVKSREIDHLRAIELATAFIHEHLVLRKKMDNLFETRVKNFLRDHKQVLSLKEIRKLVLKEKIKFGTIVELTPKESEELNKEIGSAASAERDLLSIQQRDMNYNLVVRKTADFIFDYVNTVERSKSSKPQPLEFWSLLEKKSQSWSLLDEKKPWLPLKSEVQKLYLKELLRRRCREELLLQELHKGWFTAFPVESLETIKNELAAEEKRSKELNEIASMIAGHLHPYIMGNPKKSDHIPLYEKVLAHRKNKNASFLTEAIDKQFAAETYIEWVAHYFNSLPREHQTIELWQRFIEITTNDFSNKENREEQTVVDSSILSKIFNRPEILAFRPRQKMEKPKSSITSLDDYLKNK